MVPAVESQNFPASYDWATRIISIIVVLMVATAAAAIRRPIVAALGAPIVALSYAYSPRSYVVCGRSITVRRPIGDVRFPLDELLEIRRASRSDLRGGMRLFGSGGLFGYYGLFWMPSLGKSTWYVTNRRNAVVVTTSGKTAVFSPDQLTEFIAAVQAGALLPPSRSG